MAGFAMMRAYKPKRRNIAFIKTAPHPPTRTRQTLPCNTWHKVGISHKAVPAAASQPVRWRLLNSDASWNLGHQLGSKMAHLSIPALAFFVAIALLERNQVGGSAHHISPPVSWKYCIVNPPLIQVSILMSNGCVLHHDPCQMFWLSCFRWYQSASSSDNTYIWDLLSTEPPLKDDINKEGIVGKCLLSLNITKNP